MSRNLFESNNDAVPTRSVEYTVNPSLLDQEADRIFKTVIDKMAYELLAQGADITGPYLVRLEIQ